MLDLASRIFKRRALLVQRLRTSTPVWCKLHRQQPSVAK
jgi:hypothetical protein